MFFEMVQIALAAVFLENLVFEKALGTNILLYASRKKSNLLGLTGGILYITTLSSVPVYFIDMNFSGSEYYNIIMPLIYIAVVSVIYIATLLIIYKIAPKFFVKIRRYVHLSVFNSSVLGALFVNSQSGNTFLGYIGYGAGTGLGFLLAAYLLYAAAPRLNSELVPAAFRGMPVMMVYVGIISLVLYSFSSR